MQGVPPDHKASPVKRAPQDHKDWLGRVGHKGHKGPKVRKVDQDLRGDKALLVRRELLVHRAPKDLQEPKESEGLRAGRAFPEQPGLQEVRGWLDQQVQPEFRVKQAPRVNKDR